MNQRDPFERAPEFLAAYENIRQNGFFEQVRCEAGGLLMEGKVPGCWIVASGCVPNHPQYTAKGCGSIVSPCAVISNCKELAKRHPLKNVLVRVETADWPLLDQRGMDIIGSKGTRTKMEIYIYFET